MLINRREVLLAALAASVVRAETAKKTAAQTFVFVPGAWHGAWCFEAVEKLLKAQGHATVALTLTGVSDRANEASAEVNLETHIQDVVGRLEKDELTQVTLVGHSYGGMVVTGAAARVPNRIAHLVYLDAFVPESGQSMFDLSRPKFVASWKKRAAESKSGYLVPPMLNAKSMGIDDAAQAKLVDAKLTPQPIATFEQAVQFEKAALEPIRQTYIHCAKFSGFGPTAERVKKAGMKVVDIESGHDAMLAAPQLLADVLVRS